MLRLAPFLAVLGACTFDPTAAIDDGALAPSGGKSDATYGYADAEIAAILAVANTASYDELDLDAGLDRRAAANIVAHRDGPHGAFDDLAELDGVKYVGPAALEALLAYAYARGDGDPGCLMISEYTEGQGNNNKAVELYNCGDAPVQLDDFRLCLVRNADTECTLSAQLAPATLAPGAVHTVCRTRGGTFNDPFQWLRDACDEELGGLMTFNGDDRLAVMRDSDGVVVDMLGLFAVQPPDAPWRDVNLRRCSPLRFAGTGDHYDHREFFTQHTRHDGSHLDQPPALDCL